jgi:hypothetical protein
MVEERYTRWRRASHGLHLIEPELVHTVRTLGRIDADLFARDVRYQEIREKGDGTSEELNRPGFRGGRLV